MAEGAPILRLRGRSKRFGGVRALEDGDWAGEPGEVCGFGRSNRPL